MARGVHIGIMSVVLVGCGAHTGGSSSRVAAAPDTNPVLGRIGNETIRLDALEDEIDEALRDMTNENAQRRLHLLWAGFESAVDSRLLVAEAKRRGVSIEELRQQEVASKVKEPTDEEIKSIYDENAGSIGAPFEVVAPQIKKQMYEQAGEQLERALLARLREKTTVVYQIPVPALPRYPVQTGAAPIRGPADARVTVIEFSDFECPYCARARETVDELVKLYPNTVRVAYRDFPLSQHPHARPAAHAAQCAHEQQKFWDYHDLLFDRQQALTDDDLRKYAEAVGLNMTAYDACLASDRPAAAVLAHEKAAEALGVQGTPSIFINGIKLIGLMPLPLLRIIIDNEAKL